MSGFDVEIWALLAAIVAFNKKRLCPENKQLENHTHDSILANGLSEGQVVQFCSHL